MPTDPPAPDPIAEEAFRTVTYLLKLASRVADDRIQRILLVAGHQIADLAIDPASTPHAA